MTGARTPPIAAVEETPLPEPAGDAVQATGSVDADPNSIPALEAAPAPVPRELPVENLSGADEFREAVSERSLTLAEVIERLDYIGFSLGDTRFSLWTALVVATVLVGVYLFGRFGTRLARTILSRLTGLDATQRLLAEKLLSVMMWLLAILIGVDLLGIDLTALAVFSGAFGLAVGFGLQKTFGNLIAGIILLMDRSIKPGDVIAIADQTGAETFGQIRKIGIRAVSITTRDQREYLIPNENLMINQVENWSYSSRTVRMQVEVGVSYQADIARAEELMLQAAKGAKRVLETPPPTVWLKSYGDSAVNFTIHCWITDPEEGIGNVRSDVLKRLWYLFQENGIEIPFPQRDLNLRDNEQFQQLVAAISQRIEDGSKPPSDPV